MSKNNIDDIFKKAFNESELPKSSEEDWGVILSNLKKAGHISKAPLWGFGVSKIIVGTLLTAGIALSLYLGINNSSKQTIAQKNENNTTNILLKNGNTEISNKKEVKLEEKSKSSLIKSNHFENETIKDNKENINNTNKQNHFTNANLNSNAKTKNSSLNSEKLYINSKRKKHFNSNNNNNNNKSITSNKPLKNNSKSSLNNKNHSNNQSYKTDEHHAGNHSNSDNKNGFNTTSNSNFNSSINSYNTIQHTGTSNSSMTNEENDNSLFASNFITKNSNYSEHSNHKNTTISRRDQLALEFFEMKNIAFSEESKIEEMQTLNDSLNENFKSIKTKDSNERAYIRPYFSVDYVFYSGLDDSTKVVVSKATTNEMKFTGGILGGYNVWKGLYVETGILYSNKGTNIWTFNNIDNANNTAKYHIKGQHIEIPLKLRYKMSKHFFSFYGSVGAQFKFNVSTKDSYYEFRDNENLKLFRVSPKSNSMGVSLIGNIGLELNLLPQLSFYIEPEIRYSLTPILQVKDYSIKPINPFQHSFGIGVGLNYKFIK